MLKPELVKRLETFLTQNEMLEKPATAEQIADAEKILNLKLPEDYVDFITRFGGTYAGIDIHAFSEKESVIEWTNSMRESFGYGGDRQAEAQRSIVFGDDGAGNPILINPKGEVVIYYHDSDEREVLAKSLGEFIEDNFDEW